MIFLSAVGFELGQVPLPPPRSTKHFYASILIKNKITLLTFDPQRKVKMNSSNRKEHFAN